MDKQDAAFDTEIIGRLARLETGQVGDVLDEAGLPNQVLSSDLVSVGAERSFAGRAACISGRPNVQTRVPLPVLPPDSMEAVTGEGTVLLLQASGFRGGALLGGFVAFSLQRLGCRAIVTDGPVRDCDELRRLEMPVRAGSITPANGWRRWSIVGANVPITLPGLSGSPVAVDPGDFVLGDSDGVVIVPRAHAMMIVEDAERMAEIETRIGAELKEGGTRSEVFKRHPRFSHIRTV